MRFWDTSAFVPLIVEEPASLDLDVLLEEDEALVVWWATRVECASAISRRAREGNIDAYGEEQARIALGVLSESWSDM